MRAQRMAENAQVMATYLAGDDQISNLYYPGLPSSPGHSIASKQMKNGFGGMMAFNVGQTIEDAKTFIHHLKHIYHAVSLGATETLICIPYLITRLYLPEERRLTFGVQQNTVRLSAGIEDSDLLVADIQQALEKI